MEQPRRQFLAETEDLIEQVFASLDQLREATDRIQQRQRIDEIFRQVHRVKGSAASFGFEGLSEIAHEFENLLSALRDERVAFTVSVLDTLENATTALAESLRLAASGVIEPSRRELFDNLRAHAQPADAGANSATNVTEVLQQLPSELSSALTDEEKRRLARRYSEGDSLCLIAASFALASFDEQFFQLKQKLAEHGEVISTSPAVDPDQPEKINFRILFSSTTQISDVEIGLADLPHATVTSLPLPQPQAAPRESDPSPAARPLSTSNFIRTDLDDFDRLISSTHELYRLTTRTLDLAQRTLPRAEGQTFDQLSREIRRSFLQVQDELIALRMIALGPVLHRAIRAGRAAARLADKQINFSVSGTELRLDKLLCDAIADPLVHLVRNAVDHGIERATARKAVGKQERGTIVIEAISEGGRTSIRVRDDGRGVDTEAVSRAAANLGIADSTDPLDMDRSLRLIFRPGFSTLSAASTVSGRGVGLDIVETAVEQVGGEVRVSSEPGRSSIFELRLPVTFSLLNTTVVTAGDNRYCVDASDVVRTDRVPTDEIEVTDKGELLRSASGVVPLVRLDKVLGVPAPAKPKTEISVITCQLPLRLAGETGELFETHNGKRLIGIGVDSIAGAEEVLVRNLGRHAGRWYGVAGATELRDGTIALVLDLPRLLASAR